MFDHLRAVLEEIGFTEGEVRVYLALLELGTTTVGPLISQSQISRSKVYDVIERLRQKGLVTVHEQQKNRHVTALSPERVLAYLHTREQQLADHVVLYEGILPDLLKRHTALSNSSLRLYVGYEGAKAFFAELSKRLTPQDEYLGFGFTADAWGNKPLMRLFHNFLQERGAAGITSKILYSATADKTKIPKRTTIYEFRQTVSPFPPNIDIFQDTIVLITWEGEGRIFAIEDRRTAQGFRDYFYALWKTAKPLQQ